MPLSKEDLTLEQVSQLLENPKTAEHGDVAFPAFAFSQKSIAKHRNRSLASWRKKN